MVVDALMRLAAYVGAQADNIVEIEINPLFVLTDKVCAVDVLMRVAAVRNEAAVNA